MRLMRYGRRQEPAALARMGVLVADEMVADLRAGHALFLLEEGYLTLVGTDGHRLAYIKRKIEGVPDGRSLKIVVPRKALGEVLKMTDGLFHRVFDEVGAEYPEIENEHWIVDIGAARLADAPETFDVIVLPNLYGDILSDVAAEIAGSVGLAGSANIGEHGAMFEAIHGSAPRIAGQDAANPSGLLQAAVMMLYHVGQGDVAGSSVAR